jgi:hypothetical protein
MAANQMNNQFLQSAITAGAGGMGGAGGGGGSSLFGSIGNMFGNPMTAMQYGTNIGSQQTRMLADQMRGFN